MLVQAEEEISRRGKFIRLWPSKQMADHAQFMSSFNYFDRLLYEWSLCSDSHEIRKTILLDKIEALKSNVTSISSLSALNSTSSSTSTLISSSSANTLSDAGKKIEPASSTLNQRIMARMANLSLMNSTNSSSIGMAASASFARRQENRMAIPQQLQARTKAKSTTILSDQKRPVPVMKTLNLGKAIIDPSIHPLFTKKTRHDIDFKQARWQ